MLSITVMEKKLSSLEKKIGVLFPYVRMGILII